MEKELNINVSIADRLYALKVGHHDHQLVERAVAKINNMVHEYSERYAFKDKQDLLAMVLLQYSTQLEKPKVSSKKNDSRFMEDLLYIDSLLTI